MTLQTASASPLLLLVEDDTPFANLVTDYLERHAITVHRVAGGQEAAEAILTRRPDVVILDLMLPGRSGLDICREVRSAYDGAIVILTASQSESDHVAGLELGADDFVVKPIDPRVLLARVRTQLRRLVERSDAPPPSHSERIVLDGLSLDIRAREIRVGATTVPLTGMEFGLLHLLASQSGHVVRREEFYLQVIGITYDGLDRGLDVHMSRIRRKLREAGFDATRIQSVRGLGYVLTQP